MLLTVSTTHRPATELGFLLHKHPDRVQSFSLPFGEARAFYPEASEARCTAALLPDDLEPIPLGGDREFGLGVEALERLARNEPLYRVHECVFAVLALESEPVDPRL